MYSISLCGLPLGPLSVSLGSTTSTRMHHGFPSPHCTTSYAKRSLHCHSGRFPFGWANLRIHMWKTGVLIVLINAHLSCSIPIGMAWLCVVRFATYQTQAPRHSSSDASMRHYISHLLSPCISTSTSCQQSSISSPSL